MLIKKQYRIYVKPYAKTFDGMHDRDNKRIKALSRKYGISQYMIKRIITDYVKSAADEAMLHGLAQISGLGGIAFITDSVRPSKHYILELDMAVTTEGTGNGSKNIFRRRLKDMKRALRRHPELKGYTRYMIRDIIESGKLTSIEGWQDIVQEELKNGKGH